MCFRSLLKNCCSSTEINSKEFLKSTSKSGTCWLQFEIFHGVLKVYRHHRDLLNRKSRAKVSNKKNFLLRPSFESLTTLSACIPSNCLTDSQLGINFCLPFFYFFFFCAKIHFQHSHFRILFLLSTVLVWTSFIGQKQANIFVRHKKFFLVVLFWKYVLTKVN